jgi:hypothetical protein
MEGLWYRFAMLLQIDKYSQLRIVILSQEYLLPPKVAMLSTITHACTAPVNGAVPVAEGATTLGTLYQPITSAQTKLSRAPQPHHHS